MKRPLLHAPSFALGMGSLAIALLLTGMAPGPAPDHLQEKIAILKHMSLVDLDDGQGGTARTIRFTGVNVQIVNGLGATNGNPVVPFSVDPADTATNSVGNLIVGYDEFQGALDDRTGSHNIVVGKGHGFSSFGGLVAGDRNGSLAPYASVTGGVLNLATAVRAAVHGGEVNTASGPEAVVCGGGENVASGVGAVVVGGFTNQSTGLFACVLGGQLNVAGGQEATVVGGEANRASSSGTSILGGEGNEASGGASVVCGGEDNTATASLSAVSGGDSNSADHVHATVSGGCSVTTGASCDHVP